MVRTLTRYVCAFACAAMPALGGGLLTVKVMDYVGARAPMLRKAAAHAQRVFRAAGLETAWVVCPKLDEADAENAACYQNPADLYVQVVAARPNALVPLWDNLQFGAALFGENGVATKYSYVLYDRVENEAQNAPCSAISLLGLVIAHEIGHLLLGRGHSFEGVMMAHWNHGTEVKIARGMLVFSPEEAKRLQASAHTLVASRATSPSTSY